MRRIALALLPLAAANPALAGSSAGSAMIAAVPEPGSTAIFVFALAVLGLARVARLRDRA